MTGSSQGPAARVAIVGCGSWGRNLARNFAELGVLAALVDPDATALAAQVAQHGARAASFADVLGDPAIDAVVVSTPAAQHFDLASQALEAGKHVFVEKPLALRVHEAERLCMLADRLDRRLMVGHLLQYHPAFLELRALLRGGRLGVLQSVQSNRLNLGRIRREESVLWSFAPHDVSMILALVGSEPDSVTAVGSCHLRPSIADVTSTHLTFPGGERAHTFVSWLHPFKEQKLVVIGTEGMAVFDDGEPWERKLVIYPHRVSWRDDTPLAITAEGAPITLRAAEPLRLECEHFLDCVRTGATPRTDGREGLRVLRVLTRASAALTSASGADGSAASDATATDGAAASHPPRVVGHHPGVTIHESAYVDAGVQIGEGTKIWHFSHVLGDVTLGRNVNVGQNVVIGPRVAIGDGVKIQNNVSIYEGVTIEDGVFCGPSCVFTNVNNPRAEIERKSEYRPTRVKRGATIGANATIVCGHTLGEYCFVAAGAVVTGDVPAFALIAGVPGKRIGWMSHAGQWLGPDLVCSQTGRRYREVADDRLEEV